MAEAANIADQHVAIDDHKSCRLIIAIESGSPPSEEPSESNLRARGDGDGVIDVNAEVTNGILDIGVT
jgi:hypothetical protein